MSEKIYLRPDVVDGKMMLVDQNGRILKGVFGFTVHATAEDIMQVDITLFAHDNNGKLIK